ncbi:hypothetical protein VE03_03709 [Pseudogymnoascus sp. 23342-1-I1]|nr:hypothetical protein VE03_03709 [Pseudogymnoascus sp. 23342-1-I1]
MSNQTIVTCTGPVDGVQLFQSGCFLRGEAGTRLAGALKSCCPQIRSNLPEQGNSSGTNCYVSCDKPTEQQADEANPCMIDYFAKHDENEETWTCSTPDPNTAIRGRSTGWGGLVVLCLAVSTAVTML